MPQPKSEAEKTLAYYPQKPKGKFRQVSHCPSPCTESRKPALKKRGGKQERKDLRNQKAVRSLSRAQKYKVPAGSGHCWQKKGLASEKLRLKLLQETVPVWALTRKLLSDCQSPLAAKASAQGRGPSVLPDAATLSKAGKSTGTQDSKFNNWSPVKLPSLLYH